jgi:hypothetical protein
MNLFFETAFDLWRAFDNGALTDAEMIQEIQAALNEAFADGLALAPDYEASVDDVAREWSSTEGSWTVDENDYLVKSVNDLG